jgi:2-phospho-L-lactate guanylyltransferase (CobY/MobA/RfbA family)
VVVVAHADLPQAGRLDRVLHASGDGDGDGVVVTIVPDRRDDGTNVIAVPTTLDGFTFAYGVGSFARHVAEARRCGATARIARLPDLQWDVDTPDDLAAPATT